MIARDKFKIGDKVKMSAYALKTFPTRRPTGHLGIVASFPRYDLGVIVKRAGYKSRQSWHMDFWDVVK